MKKKLVRVDLVFENCEAACIPVEEIHSLQLDKYKKYTTWSETNGYSEYTSVKNMRILFKDLERIVYASWNNYPDKFVIDRLSYPDITHIDLIFEDGLNEYLGTAWGGSSWYWNAFQVLGKNRYGEFYLELEEGWNIKKLYKYAMYKRRIWWPGLMDKWGSYRRQRRWQKQVKAGRLL